MVEGDFIMFDDISISTVELLEGRFQTFLDIILAEKLTWKSRRIQNKTFIRVANPGIPYELWDKHTKGWRRWNIATRERKDCDMEVEIVTFAVKGSAQMTVTPHRQEWIQVGRKGVALNRVFYLKLGWIIWPRYLSNSGLFMDNTSSMYRYMWSWTEMLIVSFHPRAKTVWIPLHFRFLS